MYIEYIKFKKHITINKTTKNFNQLTKLTNKNTSPTKFKEIGAELLETQSKNHIKPINEYKFNNPLLINNKRLFVFS